MGMRILLAIVVPVAFATTVVAVVLRNNQTLATAAAVHATCQQVETLKTVIRGVVETSTKSLGMPGSGGYQYYRDHPLELAQARQASRVELLKFAPVKCP